MMMMWGWWWRDAVGKEPRGFGILGSSGPLTRHLPGRCTWAHERTLFILCISCQSFWQLADKHKSRHKMPFSSGLIYAAASIHMHTHSQPWPNNVCCLSTHTNTHILEWFPTSQGVRETEWGGRGGSCLPLRSLPPLCLWWQHMTSPLSDQRRRRRGGGKARGRRHKECH